MRGDAGKKVTKGRTCSTAIRPAKPLLRFDTGFGCLKIAVIEFFTEPNHRLYLITSKRFVKRYHFNLALRLKLLRCKSRHDSVAFNRTFARRNQLVDLGNRQLESCGNSREY
jgi:hypothetical protein